MTELKQIALKRATEHARNALHLVFQPQKNSRRWPGWGNGKAGHRLARCHRVETRSTLAKPDLVRRGKSALDYP